MNNKYLNFKHLLSFVIALCAYCLTTYGQVSLTATSGTAIGSYATIKEAFDAINAGTHMGTISISLTGNTSESASAVLNSSGTGSASYVTVGISPSGGAARIITGNIAGPLIDLNGADSVMIDGLNTGGNSLEISNTNTGGSTVRFINDASRNTITNSAIKGVGNTASLGVVVFSTGTVTGNDGNVISLNSITDGATTPVNGIYSSGTTTAGIENSNNTISNNNISNFFSASASTAGINIAAGNTDWTISANRIFQTASRTYTTGNTHKMIGISSGNNYQVTNNILGYASAAGTGVYTMMSTVATRMIAIDLAVGTVTASSVQGNTITAISITTSSGAATANGVLCAINVTSGNINIGTISGNTIGATTGTGALTITPTTSQGMVVGINSSSSGTVSIQNNTIGALFSSGTTASVAGGISGINISASPALLTISGNTIGNATANNMVGGTNGLTTGNSVVSGINVAAVPVSACIITGNTIQNMASYGTGTSGYVRGIWTPGATGNVCVFTITSNNIMNLTSNNSNVSLSNGAVAAAGIVLAVGTNSVISQNTIYGIALSNTGTAGSTAAGITHGNATSTLISRNKIYDISNASTSITVTTPGVAAGIVIRSGTTATNIFNNMISLGSGQTTNTAFVGIYGNHGSTPNPIDSVINNTILITGTASSGAQPSFGFARTDFTAAARVALVEIRNNIITNTRTGGTGKHYAIANNFGATASTTGWGANVSNNNILNAAASTVGYWTSDRDFASWKSASSCDAGSFTNVPVTFVNPVSDLHLNMGTSPTVLESNAATISATSSDFDGNARPGPAGSVNGGAFGFDFGADEFDGVTLDIAPPSITFTDLTNTVSTANRTASNFASISDFSNVNTTSGTRPRLYYKKSSDANDATGWKYVEATNSSSPFSFTIDYSLLTAGSVTTGDNIQYFIVAQDLAPTPNVGITSGSFAAAPSSVALTTTAFPIGGNIKSYNISAAYSGTYTVGTGGTYTTLKAFFDALNIGVVTGNITIDVVGDCAETATAQLNMLTESPVSSNFKLTLQPNGGARSISGTLPNAAVIKTVGVSNFKIDGLNTGGNSLTITNLAATAPIGIHLASTGTAVVSKDSIMNVTVNTNLNTGTTLSAIGITVSDAAAGGLGSGYFNTVYIGNSTFTKSQYGVVAVGGAAVGTANASNIKITGCNFATSGANAIGYNAITFQGVNGGVISKNTIASFESTADIDDRAIWLASGTKNVTIEKNHISSIKYTGTGGYGTYGVFLSTGETASNNVIQNNVITDLSGDGWTYLTTIQDNTHGIFCSGTQTGVKIYNNSIYLGGNTLNQANALTTGICLGTGSTADIRNNNILNNSGLAAATGYGSTAIFLQTAISQLENADYNNYMDSATGSGVKLVGKVGSTDYATLASWQAAVLRDSNSLSVYPVFTSTMNLTPASCNLNNKGIAIAGVTSDYNDSIRHATTPDIGAYEYTPAPISAPLVSSPVNYCYGTTPSALSATGSNTLLWYTSSTGGAGSATAFTPSTGIRTPQVFYVSDSAAITGCKSARASITVNVDTLIASNSITSSPQTICSGNTPTALTGSTPIGGNGTFTYLWISSTTSATAGFAAASGTNTNNGYTPASLTTNTWYRRVVSSGVCGTDTSAAVAITVTNAIATNSITSSPQTICSGNTPTAITGSTPTGGDGSSYTYVWLSSTTSATAGFAAASGTNTNNGYAPAALSASTWYRRVVTSGACAKDTTAAIKVTVTNTIATNSITSSPQSVCSGNTPTAITGSTPTGGDGSSYTYTWLSSTTSATAGFAAASGTNTNNGYAPAALSASTWYRRVVTSGACAQDTTAAIKVTVTNTVATNSITSSPQTICSGTTPTAITGSTPTGGDGSSYTYTWLSSTTSATAGFAAASGTNTNNGYAPAALSASTWYRRVVTSGACAKDTTAAIKVTVTNSIATNSITSSPQTICSGNTPTAITGSTPTGGDGSSYTYVWLSSTTSATAGFAAASGTNTNNGYTPSALSASTWYRRVVTSGACAKDTTAAIAITVSVAGTWTGTVSNAWNNTANWSCPQLPGSSTNVTIPSGTPNSPVITDAQQANNITINSGATLTLNNVNAVLSLYGSITNNGTFTNTSGKLNLAGSSAQTLIGGTYSDLQVNNPSGVTLAGNVILNDSLVLTTGMLNLGASNLTMGNTALAGAGNTNSYVKTNGAGRMIVQNVGVAGKTGNVMIPVGNATYNPVVLSNIGTADTYTVWVIDSVTSNYSGSTPSGTRLTANAVNRTWFINETVAGGSNASVTLQWNGSDELGGFTRSSSYVARHTGTAWSSNTAAAASGTNPYTQVRTGITSFSPFGVGSSGALPVELLSFSGIKKQNSTILNWGTASENNNKGFEIQRSENGRSWTAIDFVNGAGNSNASNAYTYTDANAFAAAQPVLFYRLKQTDFDGQFAYSEIVAIENKASGQLTTTVLPNPFSHNLSIRLSNVVTGNVSVTITDVTGKTVNVQQLNCSTNEETLSLSGVDQLKAGLYFITIQAGEETFTHKVVKQ